ncbi:hypothetical protein K8R47_01210 [archaeon]|nr:hypothetical protein [archaeon]
MNKKQKKRLKKIPQVLIIGTAVVLFWRGVWGLADTFIFPNNYLFSSLVSVLIAIIVLFFTKHLIKELL